MVPSTSGALMYSEVQTDSMNDIVLQYAPLVKRIAHHCCCACLRVCRWTIWCNQE